ncbi:hypothetical protein [Nonomuraea sp. NPDC003214]
MAEVIITVGVAFAIWVVVSLACAVVGLLMAFSRSEVAGLGLMFGGPVAAALLAVLVAAHTLSC